MRQIICLFILFVGCARAPLDPNQLSLIHITDRNGLKETINAQDRLVQYAKVDFESAQPYEKVTRVFGKHKSVMTSYHSNGLMKQYLEAEHARAHGIYREWHENGQLRMQTEVIEGVADLSLNAQETWKFNGLSQVFDEEGDLIAEFTYEKGRLEKEGCYFYSSGSIKTILPYHHGQLEGVAKEYSEDGAEIGQTQYRANVKHGKSYFLGDQNIPPFEEQYKKGLLLEGHYYDHQEQLVSSIEGGNGFQTLFNDGYLEKQIEYQNGAPNGLIRVFDMSKKLINSYTLIDEKRHGEEWLYYPNENPKLLVSWYNDEIHGIVKAWYDNGALMSQREMAHNLKQGISSAWYDNGDLMLIEEYENDQLMSGKYYKKGQSTPISSIDKGSGYATLHDPKGVFLQKVKYIKSVANYGK